ncbi:MAG: hypothetical protein NTV34_18250 [Proteobacteria bacterium]|nr:hypothetical protein [Pseudomonadota bacterium]
MKSSPLEGTIPIKGWLVLINEIRAALEDDATGLLVLAASQGSGKSTFQRLLANDLDHHSKCHVLRGIVAEPIQSPGWLLNFLSEMIGGLNEARFQPRDLMARLTDLSVQSNGLVIIIDGLDLVEDRPLTLDIKALSSLLRSVQARILLIISLDAQRTERLISPQMGTDHGTIVRQLPPMSRTEMNSILEKRLHTIGLPDSAIRSLVNDPGMANQTNIGDLLRSMVSLLSSGTSQMTELENHPPLNPPLSDQNTSKNSAQGQNSLKPKPKAKPSPKNFQDFLKPDAKK